MNGQIGIMLAVGGLVVFGIWRLLHAVPLLISGELLSLVPVALFVQGLISVLAAASLFYRNANAAILVLLLGFAVGVTALLESFVWQVRAPLSGILIFVVAILAGVFVARFLRVERQR